MQIDLDENETKHLLASVRSYYYDLQKTNVELVDLAKSRKMRASKPMGFCCIQPEDQNEIEKLQQDNEKQETYLRYLRDKLKKHQMMFPCEAHDTTRRYDYGKDFGYEQCKWRD